MTDVQTPWVRPDVRLIRRNRGNIFITTLYSQLFPEIFADRGLTTIDAINRSQCFEHGAFVFEDYEQQLFRYLYGNRDDITVLRHGTITKPLTHIIPENLITQPHMQHHEWDFIDFIFESPTEEGGIVVVSASNPLWKPVVQYELSIVPPIKYVCNPYCENRGVLATPSYCRTLNIGKKKYPKGIIKFYSFTIRYRVGRGAPLLMGPYTYVKFESLSAATRVGIIRHLHRVGQLFMTKRGDKGEASAKRTSSQCFKKKNSAYCYRAENYGYMPLESVRRPDTYNRDHNSFPRIADNPHDAADIDAALNQYNSPLHHASRRHIYQSRTGHELFVPQIVTNHILRALHVHPPLLERRNTLTREQWEEANPQSQGQGGGRRSKRRRPRRTRRRRRRKKRTRRKRKKTYRKR